MSEENKHPGMELGDAALSGVSGEANTPPQLSDAALEGVSGGVDKYWTMQKAKEICQSCGAHNKTSGPVYCAGGEAALAEYLEWNSMSNRCPYFRKGSQNYAEG